MTFSELNDILKTTVKEFSIERPFLHGAALSYYALLALVPLLYLCLLMFGGIVGQQTMLDIIASILKEQIGIKDISGIMDFMSEVDFGGGSLFMQILGILALMFSCTAILNSLKKSINDFYSLKLKKLKATHLILKTVVFRFLSMLFIIGATVVIIALYFAETIFLSFGNRFFEGSEVIGWFFAETAQHGIPILMNLIIFTFLFKFLHDGLVKWKNAIVGGTITAILLYIGQLIIKYYLMNYFFAADGGVIGTMLIILVWVYYSSQILFLGAKFTAVYSRFKGSPIMLK